MKNKYHNLSRELITAKRPNQMLISAAITAIVFTATPSFAEQVPSVLPANVIDVSELNYTSPRTKAAQLKEEFMIPAQSPVEDAESTRMMAKSPHCFQGTLDFDARNFVKDIEFNPATWAKYTIDELKGTMRLSGKACTDGSWKASGTGRLLLKNTLLIGLNSGPDWKFFYAGATQYRWKAKSRVEFLADFSAQSGFNLNYANQEWEQWGINLVGKGEFGGRVVFPTVELEYRAGTILNPNWTTVRGFSTPTNGEPVQGWYFEAKAFGQLKVSADHNWGFNDYDYPYVGAAPQGQRDQHTYDLTGEGGVKFKIQKQVGSRKVTYVDFDVRYVRDVGEKLRTNKTTPISAATDRQMDRRPIE